ncbi:MAG TPA: ANTAR domain-containing protein [Gaiellales bacterium]|nr:ANTAR domain-containing protein [Gaiellales bacterium]
MTVRGSVDRELLDAQARAALLIGQAVQDDSMEAAARREALLAASLEIATYLNDHHPTPYRRNLIRALGARAGRSPEIEDAKDILVLQHGITRPEAWALLRRISQRTNRKLRHVAHEIVVRSGNGAVSEHMSGDGAGMPIAARLDGGRR